VLSAKHLLRFGGVDLLFERVQCSVEVSGDIFAGLRPLEQDTDIVNLPGKAVAKLDVFGEPPLTLECFLRFCLVIPEIWRRDLLF
jgi:hypothetical protein